jgi:hypothetical protein
MFRRTTTRRYLALTLATSVLAAATACDDDDPAGPAQPGSVRAVHAIGNGPAVDLLVDGAALTGYSNVAFKANGAYQSVAAGSRDFVVRQNGTTTALLTANDQAITSGTRYTIVALGRAGATGALAPTFRIIPDAAAPAAGQATLRILHASPAAGNVDIYVTAPNADLANEQADFTNVAFNANPVSINLAAGTYRIRLTTAGTKTVKVDRTDIALAAGQRWLALGLGDDAPGTGAASAFEVLLRQEN